MKYMEYAEQVVQMINDKSLWRLEPMQYEALSELAGDTANRGMVFDEVIKLFKDDQHINDAIEAYGLESVKAELTARWLYDGEVELVLFG